MRRIYRNQVFRFVVVGSVAAATHWTVAVACVMLLSAAPLLANVAGWMVAFVVSFSGHYGLTFRHHDASFWQAARRFFLISLAGFMVNEAVYALGLKYSGVRYDILLAVVLAAMAIATYAAARCWAFGGSARPGGGAARKTGRQ